MKKVIKVFAIVIIIVLALLIILPFAFKGKIMTAAKKAINENLNAKVEFTDLGISLIRNFPNVTVTVESLSVAGIDKFEKDTLFSAPDLRLTLDLMSVIRGKAYEVRKISANDSRVKLRVLEDGTANWDIVKSDTTAVVDTISEPSDFKVSLKKLTMNNAFLIYDDASIPFYTKADGIDLALRGDLSQVQSDLDTKVTINSLMVNYDGVRYLNRATASLDSKIGVNLDTYTFTFPDAKLIVNDLEVLAQGFFAMPEEGYDMDIKFNAVRNEFKSFLSLIPAVYAKDFNQVETAGTLAFAGFVKGLYSETTMPSYGVNLDIKDGMFKYPSLPGSVDNINIQAKIDNKTGDTDATIIDVPILHVEMLGNPVDAVIHARTPISDPYLDVTMKGKVSLDDVSKIYPLEEGDNLKGLIDADFAVKGNQSAAENRDFNNFKANGFINISDLIYNTASIPDAVSISRARIDISPDVINMPYMSAKVGRNDFSADGNIFNYLPFIFDNGELGGSLNLVSNYFNLNDLMPEASETESDTSSSQLSIIKVPKNITFSINSTFNRIIYGDLEATNIKGVLRIKDEVLSLENLRLNALDGMMALSGSYSTKSEVPEVDMTMNLQDISMREAFKSFLTVRKLAPIAEQTEGKISSTLSFNTQLDDGMMPIPASLQGNGRLTSPAITVTNVKAFNRMADALKLDQFKQFAVNKINLSFDIEDGKVFVKPFDVKMGNINTSISGWNSFDQTLEYILAMEIPRSTFGGAANNVLEGLVSKVNKAGANFSLGQTVPISASIKGLVTDPKVSLNLAESTTDLKQGLKEVVQQKKEEVVTKVKEEANKYIDEANVQAQKILKEAQVKADKLIATAEESAQKLRKEANDQANNLIAEGSKKGPIAKIAAEKAADQVKKEADKKATALTDAAKKQADGIMNAARQQADKIIADAKSRAQ
jgi:cell division septum initiation protein DivIVA